MRCTTWRLAIVAICIIGATHFWHAFPYAASYVTTSDGDPATPPAKAPARAPVAAGPTVPALAPRAASTAAATAAEMVAPAECKAGRRPYHTLLTATGQIYQQWQCRIMYRHWLKQRAVDGPCTEMTGFTRLVASQGAEPDGVEDEVPSVFVYEYTDVELRKFHGYRVVNRPYSVVQLLNHSAWKERITEEYVFIAETDHIFMHPVPNTAAPGRPSAYVFGYMQPNPDFRAFVHAKWGVGPGGNNRTTPDFRTVQPIGPSPVIIHRTDLERVAAVWHETAIALKLDATAESRLGWVIEMWGYAIASASIGLRHTLFEDFQVEPGALSTPKQLDRFLERYWVFHYTYQFEYYLNGKPCPPWTIGEYSLDKRHFSGSYPPRPLPEPPAKANVAGFWLVRAFNEAMANISTWPERGGRGKPAYAQVSPDTTYGRRRATWFHKHKNGFATEKTLMPLVAGLVDTAWACTTAAGTKFRLGLRDAGDAASTPGAGFSLNRWASMNHPELGESCPVYSCIYVDGPGAHEYNVRVAGTDPAGRLLTARRNARPARTDQPVAWECRPAPEGGGASAA